MSDQNLADGNISGRRTPDHPRPRGGKIWHNILFMTLTPIFAAVLIPLYLYQHGNHWGLWALFFATFALNNMSITSGYHRYFSHRSYDVHPIVEWLYIFAASGAFQGSCLQWSSDHRRHHRMVDTDGDPYDINRGFWFAHMLWMFHKDPNPDSKVSAKDLEKSLLIRLQHRYYVVFAIMMGFIVPGLIGWALGLGFWGGLLFGGLLRIVATQHSTFLINSFAHMFGKQTYTDKHTARDSLILAILTFGEGYHNFHHTFQADYRNGIRWYHWDPTKWWIQTLASVGLASRLKTAQKEEILKVRLAMEEKFMLAKGAPVERVGQLKTRIEEAQKQLKILRESYRAAKHDLAIRGRAWKRQMRQSRYQMRTEIRMAEIEFKSAYGQWRTFSRAVKRSSRYATAA